MESLILMGNGGYVSRWNSALNTRARSFAERAVIATPFYRERRLFNVETCAETRAICRSEFYRELIETLRPGVNYERDRYQRYSARIERSGPIIFELDTESEIVVADFSVNFLKFLSHISSV